MRTRDEWIGYIKGLVSNADRRIDVSVGPVLDVFINPMALVFSDIDFELDRIRKIVSIDSYDLMSEDEFKGILGNYLIEQYRAIRSRGIVYFQTANLSFDIHIPRGFPVATNLSFGTQVIFYTIEDKTMLVSNALSYFNPTYGVYEIGVQVEATVPQDIGSVPAGSINIMLRGLSGISRVTNRDPFIPGRNSEERGDTVKRLKQFLKSTGSLVLRDGIALIASEYSDSIVVVGAGDDGFERGDASSNAVDIFLVGDTPVLVNDFFRMGYSYLEDVSSGIVWRFRYQPVDEIVSLRVNGVMISSDKYKLRKDVGIYSGSVKGKDVLEITDLGIISNNFGKSVEVQYKYNELISVVQNVFSNDDNRVFGRDLLVREAIRVLVRIDATLVYLVGYDSVVVRNTVKNAVIDFVNNLKVGNNLEIADVIFVIKSVPGVDNIAFSIFDRDPPAAGVSDLIAGSKEYFRTDSLHVSIV